MMIQTLLDMDLFYKIKKDIDHLTYDGVIL